MLAASIAALLVITLCIVFSYEARFFNQFLAIEEIGISLRDTFLRFVAVFAITIVFALTCGSACLCHQCCRKCYKSNCLPMTDIKEYDTDCSDTL